MKKFIVPIVLFVLAACVAGYLLTDFNGSGSSFDADGYLQARARIDSLEVALWEASDKPDVQLAIRNELAVSWEQLNAMRSVETAPLGEDGKPKPVSNDTIIWVIGGGVVIVVCIALLGILSRRKKLLTQQMEALKSEQRFKEPKNGFEDELTLTPRPRPQKRSIIDDVVAESSKPADSAEAPKMAFEDENGVPENRIMSEDLDSKPTLRPTAKERITSAMQSLSDVLVRPRGLSRDRTMKLRAQSHNVTGDPNLQGSHPLETSRFDRAFIEKSKVLQMSRRGFPASAIATKLGIPQEQVESIVKESLESGN